MDWDVGRVTAMSVEGEMQESTVKNNQNLSLHDVQIRFRDFLRNFRVGTIFHYREQMLGNYRRKLFFCTVHLTHLGVYDSTLQDLLLQNPKEHLFSLEVAAKHTLKQILRIQTSDVNSSASLSQESSQNTSTQAHVPDIQVILNSDQVPSALRQVHTHEINRLIKVSPQVEKTGHFFLLANVFRFLEL